ncbi:monovalent cation:proton antiporter-2 (CPA2) family protein [Alsobacter sp. SYSU M60028]|uniref:Monovalent cation:proton antiporter-2 (CPA2) family protein n=1 Tax=Alsobacter ponti TaxID=2962936 RepID=A0ABT1LCK2_9HYPH|nr:monovalent cation:proton antiporter-2 (CPA2) family protein [Alsobacter ponti]MCP8939199.1 monovalent cation:proton antiporter-2 (CPA2) family protein [Alsobacter ponti]
MTEHADGFLLPILVFCAAAVIAVPLFNRAGLGAVVGYLAAGVAIGPSGFRLVTDAGSVRAVAELGVVLLLFVIGLELKPSRLLAMRRDIFGLGALQFAATALAVGLAAWGLGVSGRGAAVIGVAFAMSATAIALQILDERGTLQTTHGQRTFAVLLFQDMAIVPILALVPLLAPAGGAPEGDWRDALAATGLAVGALAAIVLAGRYLLNPMFRLLALFGAREVMTAAALLVVLGAAVAMQWVGMSMALGAFLAGLLLSESNFRHQLEADIEPFRGLLLGLFFMSVGMGMDGRLIASQAVFLLAAAAALIAGKIALAYGLERWLGSRPADALRSAALLAPAGEFSFVLLPLAAGLGILAAAHEATALALAAMTMALGPLAARGIEMAIRRAEERRPPPEFDPDSFADASGCVLVIGFGRFGQLCTQMLLAEGVDVIVIDRDVTRIQAAARFGFKIYYGDGTRLDVLRAAGAGTARVVAICVDDRAAALSIAELVRGSFPLARIHARAYDRIHAVDLLNAGVDYQLRETVLSALEFGREALVGLGVAPERADEVLEEVRERDRQRLADQQASGAVLPQSVKIGPRLTPEPLTPPRSAPQPLSPETRDVVAEQAGRAAAGRAAAGKAAE